MSGPDAYFYIQDWHARVHPALAEALAFLADAEAVPVPDGVLGERIDTLRAMRFTEADLDRIARIVGKRDALLQEAGVELAAAALRQIGGDERLEPALAQLVAQPIDPWVLKALLAVLRDGSRTLTTVYEGLARIHEQPPRTFGIMRNAAIGPWRDLITIYEQHAIQTLRPQQRDLAYLPILERMHRTRGWEATARAILTKMGFDPDEHFRLLRRR